MIETRCFTSSGCDHPRLAFITRDTLLSISLYIALDYYYIREFRRKTLRELSYRMSFWGCSFFFVLLLFEHYGTVWIFFSLSLSLFPWLSRLLYCVCSDSLWVSGSERTSQSSHVADDSNRCVRARATANRQFFGWIIYLLVKKGCGFSDGSILNLNKKKCMQRLIVNVKF